MSLSALMEAVRRVASAASAPSPQGETAQSGGFLADLYAALMLTPPKFSTLSNIRVYPAKEIISASGPGILKQLFVRAPTDKWYVSLKVDGAPIFEKVPFSRLASDFEYSKYVTAFESGSVYYLTVEDIPFMRDIAVSIGSSVPNTWLDFVRYEIVTL